MEDGILTVPVSAQVREGLAPEGVELADAGVLLRFDADAARTLSLPYGLPVTQLEDAEADATSEESIKDLVAANLNRSSILLGLLKNPKVAQTPGVVSMVVMRCRDLGILGSITRMAVLEGAERLGIEVTEGRFPLDRIMEAEEVLAMSTIKEVAPVVAVGDSTFAPGPMTTNLEDVFRQIVAEDVSP